MFWFIIWFNWLIDWLIDQSESVDKSNQSKQFMDQLIDINWLFWLIDWLINQSIKATNQSNLWINWSISIDCFDWLIDQLINRLIDEFELKSSWLGSLVHSKNKTKLYQCRKLGKKTLVNMRICVSSAAAGSWRVIDLEMVCIRQCLNLDRIHTLSLTHCFNGHFLGELRILVHSINQSIKSNLHSTMSHAIQRHVLVEARWRVHIHCNQCWTFLSLKFAWKYWLWSLADLQLYYSEF